MVFCCWPVARIAENNKSARNSFFTCCSSPWTWKTIDLDRGPSTLPLELNSLYFLDFRQLKQLFEHGVRSGRVDLHHSQSVPTQAPAPAKSKVGDIDVAPAQDGSDFADNPGDVAVVDIDEIAFQRNFDIQVVYSEQAQRSPAEHASAHAAPVAGGLQHHRDHVGASGSIFVLGFVNLNPSFLGDGRGVDDIRPLRHTLVQNTLDR